MGRRERRRERWNMRKNEGKGKKSNNELKKNMEGRRGRMKS